MEALRQVGALSPGLKLPDSVQDFPDGNAGETDVLRRNGAQEPDDALVRLTAHHLRDDVRVEEPGQGQRQGSRSSVGNSSGGNSTGR